ncbi:uncharacterized protein LOC135809630 [Sycon ciliatum]|uniref:uncharacterized protein LOC135809630 n=1 Tax=Sycon ciliatum TaxID=27933 RepID=UPI0031F675C2
MARLVLLLVAVAVAPSFGLDNGLGRRPQMGWNSWNKFHCNISSQLIRKTADLLVSTGLSKVGYTYVNLDDCWATSRDKLGRIHEDPKAFPEGMGHLGEYIHNQGLKFGIYSDAGDLTCAGRPGSLEHENSDAQSYADWKVDYLKYDNCHAGDIDVRERYPIMRDALNRTGRKIFFSMCEWGKEAPWLWAGPVGNSWRTTGDIDPSWERTMYCLDLNEPLYPYAGPGKWNDPDMLEVGNGLTNVEGQSHFSLWALMKAPLLIGCDISKMSAATKATLMNEEVIAVNQDPLGVQGHRTSRANPNGAELWQGPLADGSIIAILFNRNDDLPANITVSFAFQGTAIDMEIRDLWLHKDLGQFSEFSPIVPPHGVRMLKVKPAGGKKTPSGAELLNATTLTSYYFIFPSIKTKVQTVV